MLRIEADAALLPLLLIVIRTYRQALAANRPASLRACAESQFLIVAAISEYVSQAYLEVDKTHLPLEEFRYEAFRNIGALTEACILPFLRELLLQWRIQQGRSQSATEIQALDYGTVVTGLSRNHNLSRLLAPAPWNLGLNQWRNIAQHHSSRTEGDMIVAFYRAGSRQLTIRLQRMELLRVAYTMQGIYTVLRTARSLFLADHLADYESIAKEIPERPESIVLHLAGSLATQGFELTDLVLDRESVTAEVTEKSDAPSQPRMAHAMQFVYPVWWFFRCNQVAVVYRDKNERPLIRMEAAGTDCDAVGAGQVDLSYLIEKISITPM